MTIDYCNFLSLHILNNLKYLQAVEKMKITEKIIQCGKAHNFFIISTQPILHLSLNHLSWKRPSWSSSSTINLLHSWISTSLGVPFQCLVTLPMEEFSLMSKLNIPLDKLRMFPHFLSLITWEKRQTRSSLQPPF